MRLGLGDEQLLQALASELGADVPAQVSPGRWLASGAGERLQELAPARSRFGVLVLALEESLSTAVVYAEADRRRLARARRSWASDGGATRGAGAWSSAAGGHGAPAQRPPARGRVAVPVDRRRALEQAREAGAEPALVSGSGPTVIGLFPHAGGSADSGVVLARAARRRRTLRPCPGTHLRRPGGCGVRTRGERRPCASQFRRDR